MSQPQFSENEQRELAELLHIEQAKAHVQETVHNMTYNCWNKCISKINNKLDRSEEACLANCVFRYKLTHR